ncbi:MAG: hypothetical protein JWR79_1215, partial [Tardiphaga sp.]|nr:hypothetical protein [Tardiphaga sp.]
MAGLVPAINLCLSQELMRRG